MYYGHNSYCDVSNIVRSCVEAVKYSVCVRQLKYDSH